MKITNQATGTIGGGMSGNGVTRADAITFTGGSNTLTMQTGAAITGNIAIDAGTLTFNQSTAQTLSNIVTGAGGVINNSTGTLILSGANTYTGPARRCRPERCNYLVRVRSAPPQVFSRYPAGRSISAVSR